MSEVQVCRSWLVMRYHTRTYSYIQTMPPINQSLPLPKTNKQPLGVYHYHCLLVHLLFPSILFTHWMDHDTGLPKLHRSKKGVFVVGSSPLALFVYFFVSFFPFLANPTHEANAPIGANDNQTSATTATVDTYSIGRPDDQKVCKRNRTGLNTGELRWNFMCLVLSIQ